MRAVFVEYAWDMAWCDPCAADPLIEQGAGRTRRALDFGNDDDRPFRGVQGTNAFVTRLHVRYDAASFPEDLVLMETRDRDNFQGRYVMSHPWSGSRLAPRRTYADSLAASFKREARTPRRC